MAVLTTLFTFANGYFPVGGMVTDAQGDLFGTTEGGGANGLGSVFEIVNNGTAAAPSYASTPTTLVSFNDTNGNSPESGLLIDAKGNLFGTTNAGGANSDGTVFEIV